MKTYIYCIIIVLTVFVAACTEQKRQETTPWGTVVGEDTLSAATSFSVGDIQSNGELIMLTLTGPDNYYDYHGRGMGLQYLLCEKFAQHLGVSLRVDVCKDTAEMVTKLNNGEGDIIAFQLPKPNPQVLFAGVTTDSLRTQWAVRKDNKELAATLNKWFSSKLVAQTRQEEKFALSVKSIRRRVYSPMLNKSGGVISKYDKYFQQYAPLARWDWRLMAAQCYQESTFDPQARSWAGACGLMQIMPTTADHLGLPRTAIFDPESNIAAAAKYIRELDGHFADIPSAERVYFVLASYNGGSFHIRDAMRLTQKHGLNPKRWSDVSGFVLKLSSPTYYNDPVVKNGYMRGSETVGYVENIRQRWAQYRGVVKGGTPKFIMQPERAKQKYRHHL